MAETSGTSAAPGAAETPNPGGSSVDEREGAADPAGSAAGGDGTGGSVNTAEASEAGDGPTDGTSKAGG